MGVQLSAQGAIIKTAYEAEADTNAYNDAAVTKLAGIETGADVTDSTNVAAAGAVMDSDFSGGEGFMRKTGAGAYEVIKSNMAAAVAPTVNEDSGDGYVVGSRWVDTTADKEYVCLDATVGTAVWIETTGAGLPVADSTAIVKGSADGTKLMRFEADDITTGTTRVMTIPDKNITLCDTAEVLLLDGSQAMTADMDMGGYTIGGIKRLYADPDTTYLHLKCGVQGDTSAEITLYRKDYAGGGHIIFEVPNAAATAMLLAMKIVGTTDTPIVELSYGLDMNAADIDDIGALILNDATELTISSIGIVTATQSYHSIDTNEDAASDDLEYIMGGTAGQVITIRAIDSTHTVVAKDGAGNLQLEGDMTLDNAQDTLTLIYDGTNWLETSRANNGA